MNLREFVKDPQKVLILVKSVFLKFTQIRGVDTKICQGFLLGKECPDSKNSGVLKTAKSGDFETVNYILI